MNASSGIPILVLGATGGQGGAVADALLARHGGRAVVQTGVAVAIPTGYAGFVLPRSGLAAQRTVALELEAEHPEAAIDRKTPEVNLMRLNDRAALEAAMT